MQHVRPCSTCILKKVNGAYRRGRIWPAPIGSADPERPMEGLVIGNAQACSQQVARASSDSISHFLSLMTPATDDVIRSTKAYLPLQNFGMPLRKPETEKGWHHFSEVASEIEAFWSHSWHGRAWQKILTLLIIYNSRGPWRSPLSAPCLPAAFMQLKFCRVMM